MAKNITSLEKKFIMKDPATGRVLLAGFNGNGFPKGYDPINPTAGGDIVIETLSGRAVRKNINRTELLSFIRTRKIKPVKSTSEEIEAAISTGNLQGVKEAEKELRNTKITSGKFEGCTFFKAAQIEFGYIESIIKHKTFNEIDEVEIILSDLLYEYESKNIQKNYSPFRKFFHLKHNNTTQKDVDALKTLMKSSKYIAKHDTKGWGLEQSEEYFSHEDFENITPNFKVGEKEMDFANTLSQIAVFCHDEVISLKIKEMDKPVNPSNIKLVKQDKPEMPNVIGYTSSLIFRKNKEIGFITSTEHADDDLEFGLVLNDFGFAERLLSTHPKRQILEEEGNEMRISSFKSENMIQVLLENADKNNVLAPIPSPEKGGSDMQNIENYLPDIVESRSEEMGYECNLGYPTNWKKINGYSPLFEISVMHHHCFVITESSHIFSVTIDFEDQGSEWDYDTDEGYIGTSNAIYSDIEEIGCAYNKNLANKELSKEALIILADQIIMICCKEIY